MAAQHLLTGNNTPLLNRHTNDEDPIETRLPSGRCNYTNLSVGGSAPVCGCRRFWDKALATPRSTFGDSTPRSQPRSGFCMCEHHACFHDDGPQNQVGQASVDVPMTDATPTIVQNVPIRKTHSAPDTRAEVGGQDSIPDTLQWSRYIHPGPVTSLPAIPSQCLLPSENGSMTSGSQGASIRPSGLGLRTVNPVPIITSGSAFHRRHPVNEKRMQLYEDTNGNAFLQSLTEAATPSARASQDPVTDADLLKDVNNVRDALNNFTQQSGKAIAKDDQSQRQIKQSGSAPGPLVLTQAEGPDEDSLIPRLRHLVNDLADYPTKIQNHEHRLDLLENTSFSHAAIDDLQDADDRLDNRVCEVEERLRDVEKAQAALNDASSVSSRQLVNASFDSRASVTSTALIASAMDRLDSSRVEALEAQVAELQAAALPSHAHPWEVEVVFLPFGSRLMGIWSGQQSMSQRSRLNSTQTDEWTQTQNNSMAAAQACLTAHDQASAWERSATDLADHDTSWLMARACGLRSRVDERLRSRGLVRLIRILGADARDVQSAMLKAFGDLPDVLTEDPYTQHDDENTSMVPSTLKNYLGLSAPWIPLRKVHKDSCLRYLTPAEMVTPALWTVPFLSASVAMRHSGVRRLYVTQRDSYIQQLGYNNADWTWQKLRQLPRVYPDQSSFNHTPEADAHEPCWEFDERLDPPHESIHSSFASQISSLSIRSVAHDHQDEHYNPASPSDHFSSAAASPNASTTPTSIAAPRAAPLSPLKERNPFRPVHTRTTSMPLPTTVPTKSSQHAATSHAPTVKRRIASFEHETQSSPSRAPSAPVFNTHPPPNLNLNNLKRRRISRSPSRPRDTPRYSTGPPSPYAFFDEVNTKREEGMTPFAYATPYSNAPYVERARTRSTTRSSIGIYEDGDGEDDFGFGLGAEGVKDRMRRDEDDGSTTDDFGFGLGAEGVKDRMRRDEDDGSTTDDFGFGLGAEGVKDRMRRDEDEGSTTDDLNADDHEQNDEDEEGDGGEANALSDFDSDYAGEGDEGGFGQPRQGDDEWEGVQDDLDFNHEYTHTNSYDPRLLPAGKVVPSGSRLRHEGHETDDVDDQASDASSVPSEYPSRQPDGMFDYDPGSGIGFGSGAGAGKPGFRIHVDEEAE
ncbi:hypothetical protein ONS95_003019 [Cadophora gregata]|uniref:uncharacterized protein n=1 Tax=Cadophora gregata TaxID=51156 RepID=UPI0026DC0439|nr:uncharacterized protein ONS95_003019 [Cadophora gregata]KAK0108197.1 hypothetical protein ONS95_003019 [Cadophora gregata]KAK0109211.1 hypothetical protein ONS96_003034 [Cadophora gregata f. sp. sojae]